MGSGASTTEKSDNAAPASAPETAAPPTTDSRLPYQNFRELYTLKNFWKTIKRSETDCAKTMFLRYLTNNEEHIVKYGKLEGVNVLTDNVNENKAFEGIAMTYLKVFDTVIASVEANPSDASEACNKLMSVGKIHKKVTGMDSGTFQMFQTLEEPFIFMVTQIMQDRFNDKAENLFRKFFQFCLKYLNDGYNS